MLKKTKKFGLFALIFILIGCSNQIRLDRPWKLPPPDGPEDALIVGRIVAGDKAKPFAPEYIRILRKGKVYFGGGLQGIGEKTYVFTDGRFITRVKPGEFNLNAFYARKTMFQLESDMQSPHWFKVKPGQIYYIGSFHVTLESASTPWGTGSFSVERINKPTESELFNWLVTVSKGTRWEPKLRKQARLK